MKKLFQESESHEALLKQQNSQRDLWGQSDGRAAAWHLPAQVGPWIPSGAPSTLRSKDF